MFNNSNYNKIKNMEQDFKLIENVMKNLISKYYFQLTDKIINFKSKIEYSCLIEYLKTIDFEDLEEKNNFLDKNNKDTTEYLSTNISNLNMYSNDIIQENNSNSNENYKPRKLKQPVSGRNKIAPTLMNKIEYWRSKDKMIS